MFISYRDSAANGFKKWSAAHPAAKYPPKSNEAVPIGPAVSDTGSPHAESAGSSRPITLSTQDATRGLGRPPKVPLLTAP